MSAIVSSLAEVSIHDGQLDHLKAVVKEMIADIQRDEPGTLNYEWFIADDGKSCHVYERYVDADACMVHLGIFGQKYAAQIMSHGSITKMTFYGDPGDAVRGAYAAFPIQYIGRFAGVAR